MEEGVFRPSIVAIMQKICMALVLLTAIPTISPAAEKVGNWHVRVNGSATDGTESATLVTFAEGNNEQSMGILCGGETQIVFDTGTYMGSTAQIMKYSVDGGTVREIGVTPSADGRLVIAELFGMGQVFFLEIVGHEDFVVSVSPYLQGPTEMVFHLTGLDKALEPIARLCKAESALIVLEHKNIWPY